MDFPITTAAFEKYRASFYECRGDPRDNPDYGAVIHAYATELLPNILGGKWQLHTRACKL